MCLKNWNRVAFVLWTCHMFSSYILWVNLLFILWLSLVFHCLKAASIPCPGTKLVVSELTTTDCEYCWWFIFTSLLWRHNERDSVSNHRRLDCLLNRLFRRRLKKTSKFRVIGLCERNPPVTGGFPSQRASKTESVSIWWRHHGITITCGMVWSHWMMLSPQWKFLSSCPETKRLFTWYSCDAGSQIKSTLFRSADCTLLFQMNPYHYNLSRCMRRYDRKTLSGLLAFLREEFSHERWILITNRHSCGVLVFYCRYPELATKFPAIWDAITFILPHCSVCDQ